MGLVGQVTESIWDELKKFINVDKKPAWGTCAGMILLAEKVVGAR
jgi:glutamine amidotransferase PdxT